MTHDETDNGENTRIDGKKIADLPGGIHLDSHEVKWLLAAALAGVGTVLSGRPEMAVVVAGAALGVRASPGALKPYRRQPWWALAGLLVGLVIGGAARVLLVATGAPIPAMDWSLIARIIALV